MIAVFFAVPHESRAFQKALSSKRDAGDIRIVHTGMGLTAADKSARAFLTNQRPRMIISAGYAGGMDPALAHAAVFLAQNYCAPPFLARHSFPHAKLLTHARAVESVKEKAALYSSTGAQAVDMETAAIALVAAEHHVPLLAVRVISDHARAPLAVPLPVSYDLEKQCPRPLALVGYLARHPGQILPFVRFVHGLEKARSALSSALLEICAHEQAHEGNEHSLHS